ncbi:mitochondrial ribosomal protein S30 [Megachile rotundata]|uniref:mitochondrial ribosomal protein S30 n=1 Tax=Megachile rotundata TaxID=143995 RepID=UPI000258E2B7|nr:PREDICTED: 28S ribosomal protein S30, mitochondrial [Megachile rotundata]
MYSVLRKSNIPINVIRKYASTAVSETSTIEYPPILDTSYKATVKRKDEVWHNKIKKLESVEEKLFGINMPRFYGWKSLHLKEGFAPYDSLGHAQYITRTHLVNTHELPDFYSNIITSEQLDALVEIVKSHIKNILSFEYYNRLREHEITIKTSEDKKKLQDDVVRTLVYQINRILLTTLSSTLPHLLETQIDYEPRVEAFWFAGGIDPPTLLRKAKANFKRQKEYADDPVNMPVQYLGSPILQLRHEFPLKEIVSSDKYTSTELSVPQFKLDPRTLGYTFSYRHATSIPGFWPGDPAEFGLLSYHNSNNLENNLENLQNNLEYYYEDSYMVQAIFASYSWLLSQASYQGFSTVNDITYPLTTQTILTNGRLWSFCVYQLNTTLVHSEYADENPKRNLCWITKPTKLFDTVEEGNIHGFNEDVLKTLLKFYVNVPEERFNVNMKPYLGEKVKHLADIEDRDRRVWLEKGFKHIMSNRPRHYQIPEIHAWQKIYLIDNKTRPLDKKRDPWEFGYRPRKRRMDDHLPIYVPRCLRANPKKRGKDRWAKTYYPDA